MQNVVPKTFWLKFPEFRGQRLNFFQKISSHYYFLSNCSLTKQSSITVLSICVQVQKVKLKISKFADVLEVYSSKVTKFLYFLTSFTGSWCMDSRCWAAWLKALPNLSTSKRPLSWTLSRWAVTRVTPESRSELILVIWSVWQALKVSDHYPVEVELKMKPKKRGKAQPRVSSAANRRR